MIFGQTVVRIRPAWRELRGGDMVPDWTDTTETTIDRLSVQPSKQDESPDGVTVTGYRVLSEPGTTPDIASTDRVRYRGIVHDVVGKVALWPSPFGDDHVEFYIAEVKGA